MTEIKFDMLPGFMRERLPKPKQSAISFRLPKPYSDWQRMLATSKIKIAALPCATKVGKTIGGSNRILNFSYAARPEHAAIFRVIAPTYPLSKLTYQYLNRITPANFPPQHGMSPRDYERAAAAWRSFRPERSESRAWMQWPHNGSKIFCIHGSDPEVTIEGERVYGNVYDEAGKLKEKAWSSGVSTTTQTGGWNWAIGTPRGKNWFYQLYKMCEEHMDWAHRTGKPLEMFCAQAKTTQSPFVQKDAIERARKTLPNRIFRQLYEAEFLDDGSVFSGFRACVEGPVIDTSHDKIQTWVHPKASEMEVVIGVDWAKRQDWFVATAFEASGNTPQRIPMVGFLRAQGLSYPVSIKSLMQFAKRFKAVHLLKHDRTGIGDVINDLLQPLPFPIEPIVFTNSSKADLVQNWMVALEAGRVSLPNWKPIIDEHDAYDVTTTSLGLPKYGAISGEHDDVVTSCMLAYSALTEIVDRSFEVRFVDSLNEEPQSGMEAWYRNLLDEQDEEDFYS